MIEPITPVLFRMDRRGKHKEVTAVFPTLPADTQGRYMTCYAHIGQHGSCNPLWMVEDTRSAQPAEYAALKQELETIGYNLKVYQRHTLEHRKAFKAAIEEIRKLA